MNFPAVRKAMDDIGYRGWMQIEGVKSPLGAVESVRYDLNYLRGIFPPQFERSGTGTPAGARSVSALRDWHRQECLCAKCVGKTPQTQARVPVSLSREPQTRT